MRLINLIPPCEICSYIERVVNRIVPPGTGKIHVRTIHNTEKVFEVDPTLCEFLKEFGLPGKFPYRSRMIFCFQETSDGNGDVTAFFGMCTQEYGENCSPPNRNTIYLSIIDSVHLVEVNPTFKRNKIYFSVILTYLKLMTRYGFVNCYLWMCPPATRDAEYIFNKRPDNQKLITLTKLRKFYNELLTVGKNDEQPIEKFMTLHKYLMEITATDVNRFYTSLPLCDEDYWPDAMTTAITDFQAGKIPKPKPRKNVADLLTRPSDWIRYDLMCQLSKNKDFYFVKLKPTTEVPLFDAIQLTKLDSRDKIVEFFRENDLKFCDLKNGVYSSKQLLFSMFFDSSTDCDRCEERLNRGKICYHCNEYICDRCEDMFSHEHQNFTPVTTHRCIKRKIEILTLTNRN